MTDPIIKVENLGKEYKKGELIRYGSLRDNISAGFAKLLNPSIWNKPKTEKSTFWALKDINFEVNEGEVLGVIGHNGAGKSTLLKLLTRITAPTMGTAVLKGRVGSLLEVGTGFHPELTGRENVYLNGSILGLTRKEIGKKFDLIAEFSGVEGFLETPVKRYSSGMQMRLAFSVAAFLEPEILLVDEVLSVGDTAFRKKSLKKMRSVASEGRTIIFVSHNMAAIRNLCNRVMLLEKGEIKRIGGANDVIQNYINTVEENTFEQIETRNDRKGNEKVKIIKFGILNSSMEPSQALISGETGYLFIDLEQKVKNLSGPVRISIIFDTLFGQRVAFYSTEWTMQDFYLDNFFRGRAICKVEHLALNTGQYSVTLNVMVNGENADWIMGAGTVFVEQGDFFATGVSPGPQDGLILQKQDWQFKTI